MNFHTRNEDFDRVARIVSIENAHSQHFAQVSPAATRSSGDAVQFEENGGRIGRHAVQSAESAHQIGDLRVVRRVKCGARASAGQHLLFRDA